MEDAQPVSSAEEVGVVDEGSAPGGWALPAADEVQTCPKCGLEFGGLVIRYHERQALYDPSAAYEPQVRSNPCMFLGYELFPPSGRLAVGGEHLCFNCPQCGFGWSTRVISDENIYWHEPEPE